MKTIFSTGIFCLILASGVQAQNNTFPATGNVGIGTTTPAYRFHVAGGAIGGNFGITPQYANWASYGAGDGGAAIYNDNGNYKHLMIVGNTAAGGVRQVGIWDFLTVYGSSHVTGNVGIGTSTPLQRLQVEGNVFIPLGNSIGFNQADKFVFNGQNVGQYSLGWHASPGGATAYLSGFSGIKLFTEGTERFTITRGGNVYIGTPIAGHSDTYKLNVFGSARANSIVVNTNGADFVFAKNYCLRPLSEVESFIQANHHLPEIAPAAQMQAEGVSVGELQTQLLQKVEELTLYLIEQNKQLREQSKQLETQHQKIQAMEKQLAEEKK